MRIKTILQYLSTGSFTRSVHNGVLHVPQSSTHSSKAWPCLCSIHEKGTIWIHLPPTFPSHKWQWQQGDDMPSSPKHTIPNNENQITSIKCQKTQYACSIPWEGRISHEIHTVHYHPHLHVFSQDMKYMTARFPLLQFLDLKWCYMYLSTSLEAVNDDNDELSHRDLRKHMSLHSNW
jgi:hypothetical protein